MNAIPKNRTRRVRHMLGKSYLKREEGARHLINNYYRTQDNFNNLMKPSDKLPAITVNNSFRLPRTLRKPYNFLRKPYNSYVENQNIDFLTQSVARRSRRSRRLTRRTRRNLR